MGPQTVKIGGGKTRNVPGLYFSQSVKQKEFSPGKEPLPASYRRTPFGSLMHKVKKCVPEGLSNGEIRDTLLLTAEKLKASLPPLERAILEGRILLAEDYLKVREIASAHQTTFSTVDRKETRLRQILVTDAVLELRSHSLSLEFLRQPVESLGFGSKTVRFFHDHLIFFAAQIVELEADSSIVQDLRRAHEHLFPIKDLRHVPRMVSVAFEVFPFLEARRLYFGLRVGTWSPYAEKGLQNYDVHLLKLGATLENRLRRIPCTTLEVLTSFSANELSERLVELNPGANPTKSITKVREALRKIGLDLYS